jgi:hypothetical protein
MRRLLDLFRNPITSETVTLSGIHFRVTRERGRIIGIEKWENVDDVYYYHVWTEPVT